MATAPATATPPAPSTQQELTDAKIFASPDTDLNAGATNRIKGFLGQTGEIIPSLPADPVAHVKALSNEELFPLGEKALRDIADDIIVLDEIRNRFRAANGVPILGYASWREFVEKNSLYSIRTIQNRLADKNGKDLTKVNAQPGNKYTRVTVQYEEPKPEPITHVTVQFDEPKPSTPALTKKAAQEDLRKRYSEPDFYERVGRAIHSLYSHNQLNERLSELKEIRKSHWCPAAEKDSVRCFRTWTKFTSRRRNTARRCGRS
jgi:hypothetical protein